MCHPGYVDGRQWASILMMPSARGLSVMDPQAAWDHLLEAYTHGDWSVVEELAEGLLKWLHRGGFPPRPVFEREIGACQPL